VITRLFLVFPKNISWNIFLEIFFKNISWNIFQEIFFKNISWNIFHEIFLCVTFICQVIKKAANYINKAAKHIKKVSKTSRFCTHYLPLNYFYSQDIFSKIYISWNIFHEIFFKNISCNFFHEIFFNIMKCFPWNI